MQMFAEVATIASAMRALMAFDILGGTPEEWLPSKYGPPTPDVDEPEPDAGEVEVSADDRARAVAAEILA